MKIITAIAAAGVLSSLACGAAFAQSPNQIPLGAGSGVTRPAAGSRAAALPAPPPAAAAPVVVVPEAFSSWTGAYVGGDFGGSFASTSIASNTSGWTSTSLNNSGVMGGAYLGYNYQVSRNFVFGVEGDFQGAHNSNNHYFPAFDVSTSVEQNWVGSLNGRLGIVYDRALFYAIGGGAWGQSSATVTPGIIRFPATLTPISHTADLAGWDVGGGLEYALTPHWVGRLEYRYYDFGSYNLTNFGRYQPLRIETSANTVRIGLAYLFANPAPVVTAKY
jgi:outer membrane immunogenic protein